MFSRRSKSLAVVVFAFSVLWLSPHKAFAQVEKGTKEILFLSSGFSVDVKEPETKFSDLDGTLDIVGTSRSRHFSLGGKFGYFLSQRNEIGGGTNLYVSHFRSCSRTFRNGQLTSEECDSHTNFGMGVSGFYRYNLADKGDKRFPFVGADLFVLDVKHNFTGNFRLRPQVGYKYFLNKNVALDLSLGYTMELNEKKESDRFFITEAGRRGTIDGQVGLSFVFK